MNSLRKKLGGLIPSDGARDALQNVLTVEWAGHKTVLVEVPAMPGSGSASASGSMSSRFNGGGEMEMSGMGRDRERPRGEYERLDGWFDEDERAYLNRPVESHRRSSASATAQASAGSGSASGQRRPPAAHSRSLPASAAKKLPPLPARPTTANPFEDDEDDFFPDPVGPQQHYRQRQMAEESEWDYPSSLSHWGGEWRPAPGAGSGSGSGFGPGQAAGPGGAAGGGGGKKKENPWKVEERFGVASVTSPTFSMGSQSSKATSRESEDPFR